MTQLWRKVRAGGDMRERRDNHVRNKCKRTVDL